MKRLFLSYSRHDTPFVQQLKHDLVALGFDVWMDVANIAGGEQWRAAIIDGMTKSDAVIVCLSLSAVQSKQVSEEIYIAQNLVKKIFPIMLDDCMAAATAHPNFKELLEINIVSFNTGYATGLSRLSESLRVQEAVHREDWGSAPDIQRFYGRDRELAMMRGAILDDHCRILMVLAMGGMGKTSLCVKLVESVKDAFTYVLWIALQNAPPLEQVLGECIRFISDQMLFQLPDDHNEQINLFIKYMQSRRCLIVFDNFESLLQGGHRAGEYRPGYEEFGVLLRRVGESRHQSCLLITSREKPKEIALLENTHTAVRAFQLAGLQDAASQELLQLNSLTGTPAQWHELVTHYSGNPLALKLVASHIHLLYGGDIGTFLQQGMALFGDIEDIFDRHFTRLSPIELSVVYWLAIEREPVTNEDLKQDFAQLTNPAQVFDALESLHRRSIIESVVQPTMTAFTLQPAVMEFVTERFIKQITHEIRDESIDLFQTHALLKARAKTYVKESQVRLIIKPIGDDLTARSSKNHIEKQLMRILAKLRDSEYIVPGYAGGNTINLLRYLGSAFENWDFSGLSLWEADIAGIYMQRTNLRHADLSRAVFTKTFASSLGVAFSPDGTLMAIGTAKGDVRIIRVADTEELHICEGHTDWLSSVAFSPDGKLLASGSEDATVRLWDVATGAAAGICRGHVNEIWSIAYSPDGKTIVSGSKDQSVKIWDVATQECLATLQGHTAAVWGVAYHPQGHQVASASEDWTIKLWDVPTQRCVHTLQGHTKRVLAVAFSSDGITLASGADDQTVKLWDCRDGRCVQTLRGHTDNVLTVAFNGDGTLLASGSEDRTIHLWNPANGQLVRILQGHTAVISSVRFSPVMNLLGSVSDDQTVRLWDVKTGQGYRTIRGHTNEVWSVAFGSEKTRFISGGDDRLVRLWEANRPATLKKFWGHTARVRAVALSADGRTAASGGDEGSIFLWDLHTGANQAQLTGHAGKIRALAFSRSPRHHLLASGSEDTTIKLWDVHTHRCVQTLSGHTLWIRSIACSPDHQTVLSGGDDNTIRLWSIKDGRCLMTLPTSASWAVGWSKHGRTFVSGGVDRTVQIWDAQNGKPIASFAGHTSPIWCVAFSPDDTLVASSSTDHTIRLWEVRSGRCIAVLDEHTGPVRTFAFNANGRLLVSGSEDETLKVWKMPNGECIQTLHPDKPYDRMNITGVTGISAGQKASLLLLGATENS